jgi:hypothetical protein
MARQGEGSASEFAQMKTMIGTLAESVKTLSNRQSAPADQVKECQALTETIRYEQRCLKRDRESDGKKQGIVKQQNLLDELACQVKAATAAVESAQVYVPEDPNVDMSKAAKMKLIPLGKTTQGAEIVAVLSTAAKLLSERLLELCVVTNASSVSVGWATVESLSGASYGDYCEDDKQTLRVKEALAEQEKRALAASDRAHKERDRAFAQHNGGGRRRQPHRQVDGGVPPAPPMSTTSWDAMTGQYVPMPPPPPPRGGRSTVMQPSVASAGLPARGFYDHSANDLCYRCQKTGHKSYECTNAPAPGRH